MQRSRQQQIRANETTQQNRDRLTYQQQYAAITRGNESNMDTQERLDYQRRYASLTREMRQLQKLINA